MPDTILRPAVERPDPQVIAMNEAAARLGAAPADPLTPRSPKPARRRSVTTPF